MNTLLAKISVYLETNRWLYRYKKLRKIYNLPLSFGFNGWGVNIYGEGKLIVGENSYIGQLSAMMESSRFNFRAVPTFRLAYRGISDAKVCTIICPKRKFISFSMPKG